QIGLALLNYESAKKYFPAGRHGCDVLRTSGTNLCGCETTDAGGIKEDGASAFVEILPYMEYNSLYDLVHYDRGGIWSYVTSPVDYTKFFSADADGARKQLVTTRIPMFLCPSTSGAPTCEPCAAGSNDPEDK